jgi:hypothetical protein
MKTLEDYKKYYKQKYPNLSNAQITDLAKAAMAKDKTKPSANDAPPTFGETTVGGDTTKNGVRVGFGLTDKNGNDLYIQPGMFPKFMTTLSVQNPKVYNTILRSVFQATGTKYKDPNTLGTWLEGSGKNLLGSARQDPTAATISMESLISAGIVNRGAAGIFGDGGKENIPTRQIYNIGPEQVASDIEDIALKILGRSITDADKEADWYNDLVKGVQKLYSKGVVSEPSKIVVNKKTGKKERLVPQTPEFSKEQVTQKITETLTEADPISLERKKNLDFANWAIQKMGGGR